MSKRSASPRLTLPATRTGTQTATTGEPNPPSTPGNPQQGANLSHRRTYTPPFTPGDPQQGADLSHRRTYTRLPLVGDPHRQADRHRK